ncbi:ABC transporter permease [Selenihalanaerobacter shriftii]|uniref:Putative ABC transport system permease protein n=1 Tax=Selenihalanaerobacter shriftii TaxID=142842 RepID=A0A1T4K078_9FIRM|nr:iron export ABC transporter permease subunit FetB [Selenihalanaerobacter shriftii]SJZ35886.1 putative ABC transport system permease protein [Selenihalanaerobacter shriftii]
MNQQEILNLQLWQLIIAYSFIMVLLIIFKTRGFDKEQEIILSMVRMTIQLVLVGYVLSYVFEQSNYLFTLIIIIIMEAFAINNIYQRVQQRISLKFKKVIALAMVMGTLVSMIYFIIIVINLRPWYEARYFIPLAGMLIGNSMTGISLGVERLISGIKDNRDKIEATLMLGATPKKATREVVNAAFNAAILPTINSMMGMGIVFLPGMMTGQILSGSSPITAIKYQIIIMLGILASVSLTVFILVNLGYKTLFNERAQLVSGE